MLQNHGDDSRAVARPTHAHEDRRLYRCRCRGVRGSIVMASSRHRINENGSSASHQPPWGPRATAVSGIARVTGRGFSRRSCRAHHGRATRRGTSGNNRSRCSVVRPSLDRPCALGRACRSKQALSLIHGFISFLIMVIRITAAPHGETRQLRTRARRQELPLPGPAVQMPPFLSDRTLEAEAH